MNAGLKVTKVSEARIQDSTGSTHCFLLNEWIGCEDPSFEKQVNELSELASFEYMERSLINRTETHYFHVPASSYVAEFKVEIETSDATNFAEKWMEVQDYRITMKYLNRQEANKIMMEKQGRGKQWHWIN